MHVELTQAGIRPPLLRALSWSALGWLVALLLPVRVEPAGAVWVFDLVGTPSGDRVLLTMAFAALALGLLGAGDRTTPRSSRALIAITATFVGLAGVLADPDAQASLLPYLPGALSRGYVTLAVALSCAAAALRSPNRTKAGVLLAGAGLSTLWLYLWPHPFGTLLAHAQSSLHNTLAASPARPLGASLTQLGLSAMPGALVILAAVIRTRADAQSQRTTAGWLLAATPAILVSFGLKGAAALGADSVALVGLRAAAIFFALTLALTAGLEAFSAHAPSAGSRRFRIAGHGLTLAALAFALVPHIAPAADHHWRLSSAPVWAEAFYAHTLPSLAIAADARDLPGGHDALRAATTRARAPLEGLAALDLAVRDLGEYSQRPGRNRRRLEAVGHRLNEAARQAGLPYFVDLEVVGHRASGAGVRWSLYLKTYRIERARRFLVGTRPRTSLWLRRLDRTNLVDARLGWTAHDAPEGMVVLGAVRDHWREDLAPALAGTTGTSRRARIYARHARPIAEDLAQAISSEHGARDLATLLECSSRATRNLDCKKHRARVEPRILEVLAEKVEVHELRHAADGARLPPPEALLTHMASYDESDVHFATAELSAYLAEVAGARVPRLALAHLLALRDARPRSPEGFAGRVAEQALRESTGLDTYTLMRRPSQEVAAAAAEAYQRLFGVALAPASPIHAAPDVSSTDETLQS